jgi:hypothetical protein
MTLRPSSEESQRSREACPVCGAHQLALEHPPEVDVLGVQPYSDLLGMGDLKIRSAPAIKCLNCGTLWRDLEAFRNGDPEPSGVEAGADEPADEGEDAGEDEPDDADGEAPDEEVGPADGDLAAAT